MKAKNGLALSLALLSAPVLAAAQARDIAADPDRMEARIDALGLSYQLMPSGAGHDAQDLATIAPTGMIFVPSRDGISHSPQEFTSAKDMANGATVLLKTVMAIDGGSLE